MGLNIKSKKLIAELSWNSRATSQSLGKLLRTSQQSVNYLLHALEKRGVIKKYVTAFDTSRFGLANFIVLLRCKFLNAEERKKFEEYLENEENVTKIEKLSVSWDFLVMYSTQNISQFNKSLKAFLTDFKQVIDKLIVLPVIVKYEFGRKYLNPKRGYKYNILFGDREYARLSEKELQVCNELRKNARESLLGMAKHIKTDPKTIARIKKRLGKEGIIQGYSITLEGAKEGIRRFLLLLKLKDYSTEADKRLTNYCKHDGNIVSLIKLLGEWDILLEVEMDKGSLVDFLNKLREENSDILEDFLSAVSDSVVKDVYLPNSVF